MTLPRTASLLTAILAAASMLFAGSGLHEGQDSAGGLPLVPTRTISFTTTEGTWMSVDVSPDGQSILFDLLGDLYVVPISGGTATRITEGMAVDTQPRYSPDGERIVFLSDRDGADNVWIAEADGRNPRRVTNNTKAGWLKVHTQPQWTPEGTAIVVTRQGTGFGYDLVVYDLAGKTVEERKVANPEPASTTAGMTYAAAATFGGGWDALYATQVTGRRRAALDTPGTVFQVVRIDPSTGKRSVITDEVGGAVQPLASPDGRYLAYATKYPSSAGPKTGLKLLDLTSHTAKWLVPEIEPSQQGFLPRWSGGLLPNMAFTPDSQAIVASWGGKIWRVEIASGARNEIPFRAEVVQKLGPLLRFSHKHDDDELTARIVRDVRPSRDGRLLAFVALDKVWVMDPRTGIPSLAAPTGDEIQYSPAWSPDGKYLAFLTWTERGGNAWRIATAALGTKDTQPERLTNKPDFYDKLVFSPGGQTLVLVRAWWRAMLEVSFSEGKTFEVSTMPADGGELRPIFEFTTEGVQYHAYSWPHFSKRDPTHVFFYAKGALWSIALNGSGSEAVATTKGIRPTDLLLSPDGTQALFVRDSVISLLPIPKGDPKAISLDPGTPGRVHVRELTPSGGESPYWSDDGQSFSYSFGHSFFTYNLKDAGLGNFDCDRGSQSCNGAENVAYQPERLDILVRMPKDKPHGTILLSGGRIITMQGRKVIERGDVLVRDNRIVAVGPQGTVQVPQGTFRFDVRGKTILPGYVATHEHAHERVGVHTSHVWEYLMSLAYGVTTTADLQADSSADRFCYVDQLETGYLLGPRVISTGTSVWEKSSALHTRDMVRRYARFYDSHMLKSRDAGNRQFNQWLAISAQDERLILVGHWSDQVSRILDGYSGVEHATYHPWYEDMIKLLAQSQVVYTPTTIAGSNGPIPMGFFAQQTDLTREKKLWRFAPQRALQYRVLDPHVRAARALAFRQDYAFKSEAEQAATLVKAGGRVGVAGDGFLPGLGIHWEMWALAMGGMAAHDVLRSATLTGAEAIGMDANLGSIESGKLADLQILDDNPLMDIRETTKLRYVMKNGRLYEADTLDEVWPRKKLFVSRDETAPWWWEELPPWAEPQLHK